MTPTKPCEICGSTITKNPSVSRANWPKVRFCSVACKAESQRGKPTWNKGRAMPKTAPRHPCRICGEPTKYRQSDKRLAGMVHCGRPACAEESRRLKNDRIGEAHRVGRANGTITNVGQGWKPVPRVSNEEQAIAPWLESQGWIPQYRLRTGVHTNKLPRMFWLDFALPERKLYIEIDGSVHRHLDRRARDERRNTMLAERGWRGLRLPARVIRDDIVSAQETISQWLASLT